MKTLSVCSSKGGVGKSTIATALACAAVKDGLKVALVDLDPQGSMNSFWTARGETDNPQAVSGILKHPGDTKALGIGKLHLAIKNLAEAGFDLAMIDTPPALMSTIRTAIINADFVLIPTQPSAFDIEGITAVVELVTEYRKDFAFIINRTDPRDRMTKETIEVLKTVGPVIPQTIGNRKAYRAAVIDGKTGAEIEPAKAGQEIKQVWAAVKKRLHVKVRKAA